MAAGRSGAYTPNGMDLSTRPVELIAIAAVVGGGLWAALSLAPGGASSVQPAQNPFLSRQAVAAPAAAPQVVQAPRADGDRLLVVPDRAPAQAAAAAGAAASAGAREPRRAQAARFSPPHLKATRPVVDPEYGAQTSAFMAAAPAAGDAASSDGAQAGGQQPVIASRGGEITPVSGAVHYGVVDRASLMGRGAGPVYNFKGSRSSRNSSGQ